MIRKEVIKEVFKATPHLLKFPERRMWIDYDEGADVLYISFKRRKSMELKQLEMAVSWW